MRWTFFLQTAKADGICGLTVAQDYCPRTCDACPRPVPQTQIRGTPQTADFCLATWAKCDGTTACGSSIGDARKCEEASKQLGLTRDSASILNDAWGPTGCFFVEQVQFLHLITRLYSSDLSACIRKTACTSTRGGQHFRLTTGQTPFAIEKTVQVRE